MRKNIRGKKGNCSGHKTSLFICNSFAFGGMVTDISVDVMPAISWVGTLAHLMTFLGISFTFDCFSRPLPLFPSSHLPLPLIPFPFLYIFQSSLPQVSSKEELEIVIINHLVFNWVLINICGLRSHPSLRISGGVMEVYIILTSSPKRNTID